MAHVGRAARWAFFEIGLKLVHDFSSSVQDSFFDETQAEDGGTRVKVRDSLSAATHTILVRPLNGNQGLRLAATPTGVC